MTAYFLIAGGAALLTASCCWYFRKKATASNLIHQRRVSELEDALWRLQMNPHFLNNCLNSLNSTIHQGDKQSATRYVTTLSRLVRNVLEHSEEATITLAVELDTVRQYIHMEQLRFGDQIAIEIITPPDIDPEIIIVPPLFIQPFVENALIHGLLPRQACGTIVVEFLAAHKEILSCSITDDGIGRKQSATAIENVPSTNKSLGIAITRKRIAAFNKAFGRVLPFTIHDLVDADGQPVGTSVAIQLARVSSE